MYCSVEQPVTKEKNKFFAFSTVYLSIYLFFQTPLIEEDPVSIFLDIIYVYFRDW